MNVYETDRIRNIALVGHQGAGKTMLAEAMLRASGRILRMGSIAEGTTVSDYHPSEKERQMSVFSSLLHVEWNGVKINILDTPGYPDFVGEVVASLHVADAAVFVINAAEGVQVGTELAWRTAEELGKPAMFVINHLDKSGTDFRATVEQIRERFGRGASIVQLPYGEGSRTVVDVLLMKQIAFEAETGAMVEAEIDAAHKEEAETIHNELVESIAENDEGLMDLFFDKGTLSEDEMRKGLHVEMIHRQMFPIFITSATQNIGVSRLMSFIVNVFPKPHELPPFRLENGGTIPCDPKGEPVAFIFRTMAEQHVGDYSFFKVCSGEIAQGLDLVNDHTSAAERIGQIFSINGHDRENVTKMYAGDIGALVKLRDSHTNDTLFRKGSSAAVLPIDFPEPRYSTAVVAAREGEEDKIAQGLHQLANEDPSLILAHDQNLGQMVLGGQGEMHLEIARYRLKNRFGVDVEYVKPRVAYRETVQQQARAKYRHKKQTGGAGQFADISLLVEPLNGDFVPPADITVRGVNDTTTAWGSKIQYIDAIVGGVIDMRRFFGAIQKGISEALQNGPVAGYPVGDVRVVIYDGGMHAVDSNENAFKTAARMGFRQAFRDASPILLEPIHNLEVTVPEAYTGDVMGDLNNRRARIQGIESEGVFQRIVAQAPESELYRYSTVLRSLTQGRGLHKATFSHYETMPRHVQDKVVAEAAAAESED